MASSTPLTSPVSPAGTTRLEPTSVQDGQTRTLGFSEKQEAQNTVAPRTPSHARNTSGSSIRTAIRVPKTRGMEREREKVRKDSIGMPQMLGSPFDGEGGEMGGVGEAI
jgi:hypothetical protein